MKLSAIFTIITTLFLSASQNLNAQPGTLDKSFGEKGVLKGSIVGNDPFSALLPDNKIIAVGCGQVHNLRILDSIIIVRSLENGEIDSSFANLGVSIIKPDIENFHIVKMQVDLDGKILLLAKSYKNDLYYQSFATRINSNGKLDSSFGDNGFAILNSDSLWQFVDLQIQDDGKIVFAGNEHPPISKAFILVRLLSKGNYDTSFGINGTSYIKIDGDSTLEITTMALQPDGKILTGGNYPSQRDPNIYDPHFIICRCLANGKVDYDFGRNGISYNDFGTGREYLKTFAVQMDGKILAGGSLSGYVDAHNIIYAGNFSLIRYLNSGQIDSSFGINGIVEQAPWGEYSPSSSVSSICIETDGKIVAAGWWSDYLLVKKFLPDGDVDLSFGNNGHILPVFSSTQFVRSIYWQNNKIILSGGYVVYDDVNESSKAGIILARYNNETVLPLTLTSFTATKKENTTLLQWRTCNELNTKGFTIERSTDNRSFTPIGFVNAKGGNNNCNNDYNFIDNTPLPGTNYYRLQLMDNDGQYSFSDIKDLSFIISSLIKISPNPVQNIFKIEGLGGINDITLSIMNAAGKIMATAKTNQAAYNWNIQSLAPGMYYLVVLKNNGEKQVLKFVKE